MKKIYTLTSILLVFLSFACTENLLAQTTPPAQALQYSQNFTALAAASTIYPAGIQGWSIGTAATAAFRTTGPTGNSAMIASSTAAITTGGVHNYNGKIGILPTGTLDPSLGLAINTLGYSNIRVNFDAMTIRNPYDNLTNTAISGFELQYRVTAIAGTWTSATGMANGFYQNNTVQQIAGTTPQNSMSFSFTLPAACDNQSIVFLRWVARDVSGAIGALGRPSFAVDNIAICANTTQTVTITGPTAACTGQSAIYGATTTNAGASPVYQWKRNGTNVGTNVSVLTIASLAVSDQITCTITSGACATATSNIIQITTVGTPPTISTPSITNVSCVGVRNGAINITASGGTAPYTYAWDTTNTINNGTTFIVSVNTRLLNLNPPGNAQDFYLDGVELRELFVTKGITYTFMIGGGHPFHIATNGIGATTLYQITSGQTPATAATSGNMTLVPNNFHPPILYYSCTAHLWMGYKINLNDGYAIEDLTNLVAGKYAVVVKDANGCTATGNYTVAQGSASITGSVAGSTDASCNGAADGTINLNPSGGTAPYSATGTGPTFTVIAEPKNHSHPQFGIGSGNAYNIDGVQGKTLTLMRGVKYAFSVNTPGHPFFISTSIVGGNYTSEVTDGVIGSRAETGTLFFTPNASHPNLLYYQCGFHGKMGWTINIVDQLPNADLGNCMAGDYSLQVKDANGCMSPTPLNVTIAEPPPNLFYYDGGDSDGYGDDNEFAIGCNPPPGFVVPGGDCAPTDPSINPGMPEICNTFDDDCDGDIDEGCSGSPELQLKVYIQGFYSSGGFMDNNGQGGNLYVLNTPGAVFEDVDTVLVSVMEDSPPYTEVETQAGILQTDGSLNVIFGSAVSTGTSYYIRLVHRNSLETWSKLPVMFSSTTSYDFSVASTQAYDDGFSLPMKLVDTGIWALYNGDINDDGTVDATDMTSEENAANAGDFGYYLTDINGDGGSDALDMTIVENNGNTGVFESHP